MQAFFRTLGYPDNVASRLGGICTNSVARNVWTIRPPEIDPAPWNEARILYARPHLPQGAPTSPALANLIAYRLDGRLSGLAKAVGAAYTRYADDLAFSGGEAFNRVVERFSAHAAAIALEEGFSVNHRKTRIKRSGVRQHLAGLVVNEKINFAGIALNFGSDLNQLRALRPGISKPRPRAGLPGSPRRPHRIRRHGEPRERGSA